jgi:hypothetical protein
MPIENLMDIGVKIFFLDLAVLFYFIDIAFPNSSFDLKIDIKFSFSRPNYSRAF